MKKIVGISLAFAMFLAMSSQALAADNFAGCCQNQWYQNCQTFHWQWSFGGCQPSQPNLPATPSTPGTPDTPTEDTPDIPSTPSEDNSTSTTQSYAEQVAALVNEERAAAGLSPVTLDEDISAAAQVRAIEAATSFSHTRPNGTSCFTALKEAGISYRGAGENIAYGQSTPTAVMADWMNSSGHRANILNEKYTKIGVGYTVINGVAYWSQFFTY